MDSDLLARFILGAVAILFVTDRLEYHDTLCFLFKGSRAWDALRYSATFVTVVMCAGLVIQSR